MQALVVSFVVAIAAIYVAWRFMPVPLRARLVACVGALARSRGLASERAAWLQTKLSRRASCGNCDACAGCRSVTPAREPALGREIAVSAIDGGERAAQRAGDESILT